MSSAGTVEQIIEAVGRALSPLMRQLTPGQVVDFFTGLGLKFPPDLATRPGFSNALSDAQGAAAALKPIVQQLSSDINAGNTAAILANGAAVVAQIVELLNKLDALGNQLAAISGSFPGISTGDVSAFASNLTGKIFDLMLVEYLESTVCYVVDVAAVAGLIDRHSEPGVPSDASKPAFVVRRLRLDRLPQLLQSPPAYAQALYGWGSAGFNGQALFEQLLEMAGSLGLPAVLLPPSGGQPASLDLFAAELQVDSSTTPSGLRIELRLPIQKDYHAKSALAQSGWDLETVVKGRFDAGLIARVAPPALISLSQPSGVTGGEFQVQLSTHGADDQHPLLLLGQIGGTRLQGQSVNLGAGATFHGDTTSGSAKGGATVEFKIEHGNLIVSLAGTDGFLASLLPAEGLDLPFDFLIGYSDERGLYFGGGATLETSLPIHKDLGPITIDSVHLALGFTADTIRLGIGIDGDITFGPISASVQDIGANVELGFHRGNLGMMDLQFKFRPPAGLGIAIDAGPITGGGFIAFDEPNARYAGIIQLKLLEIGVTAIGLLDTRLPGGQPGYSFLIIIAVNLPPIQLSFGFVLTGIGGLIGINRTVVTDAITKGLRNGILDHIMFPPDPIRNAPQIISDLRTIFPPVADRYVFGPMLQLAWGTPSLIIAQLGVILELPDPVRIILIGQLKMALPTEDVALVEIHIDVLGIIDFGQKFMSIVGSMHDSRITIYSMYGDMAVRVFWGDPPNFAFSMGGWNPHFTPPPGMPALRRLTVAIGLGDNPRITSDSYFAVTSNSFQFGAHAELYAGAGGFSIRGWIGFDALVIFSPFSFIVDVSAGVELKAGSSTLASIHLSGQLSGPNPWHISGEACLSLFFFDICVGFSVTIGDKKPEDLPTADPWPLLEAAIKKPESWSATIPAGGARAVSLAIPPGSTPPVLVDPLGGISLHEKVLPLNRKITKFGEARPIGPDHYNVTAVRVGAAPSPSWALVKDYFAIGQFQELSDPEKLSRPSFEPMDAGVSVASDAAAHGGSLGIDVVYETIIVDAPDLIRFVGIYALALATQMSMTSRSAAATAPIWKTGLNTYNLGLDAVNPFKDAETIYTVASTVDLSGRFDIGQGTIGETHDALDAYLETHPGERGELQVIPLHELEVA